MATTDSDTLPDAMREKASAVAGDARDMAHEKADETVGAARDRAQDELRSARSATDAAAEELPEGSLQAEALSQASGLLDTAVASLNDVDFDTLAQDVSHFARRNPLLFLGGAALAGFAAARFLKAGDGSTARRAPTQDPWSGHVVQRGDRS
ncbi:hypothetical protein [Pseudoponticoccus marisrubri]|uniref:Uncharacterized protein n=1 Tax=Pseudoponticoccus marisrubri TaxID=1685382 RepID=A0A0W7WIZ0_9RHOB|nr:hypothetical protein [Pseudoponticoccus marisrubri]KUF10581.1 hypothetical protein AVJ23_11930 [Pseudoponticoccus marisrubri]